MRARMDGSSQVPWQGAGLRVPDWSTGRACRRACRVVGEAGRECVGRKRGLAPREAWCQQSDQPLGPSFAPKAHLLEPQPGVAGGPRIPPPRDASRGWPIKNKTAASFGLSPGQIRRCGAARWQSGGRAIVARARPRGRPSAAAAQCAGRVARRMAHSAPADASPRRSHLQAFARYAGGRAQCIQQLQLPERLG